VAVKSAHQTGKSFTAGGLVGWWISVHPPGEAMVVTTAPTFNQVRAILWREVNRVRTRGNLPGYTNQTEWLVNNELVALGRKPEDASPDAFQGMHARHMLVLLDEACHDDQTDVLTDRGWLRFAEVKNERLLTMDPATGIAEYLPATNIVRKHYTGPMYSYKSRNANFCVTPDHEMWVHKTRRGVERPKQYPYKKMRMADLAEKHDHFMSRTVCWIGEDHQMIIIPELVTRKLFPQREFQADDWFTLLGWWFSEGHLGRTRGVPSTIGISQKDNVVRKNIFDLCVRLGFNPSDTGFQVQIYNRQIAEHFAAFGKGCLLKRLPDYVRNASPRLLSLFLDSYVLGDGYSRNNGRDIIFTSNTGLKDDIQEIILKSGFDSVSIPRTLIGLEGDFKTHIGRPTVDGWVISRCARTTELKFKPENVTVIDYDGDVFCATVPPHHLLLTRRDGRCIWSGNCGVPGSLWVAAESLVANEGGKILAIGNPDDPNTEFGEICKPGSGWHVITVSAFDTPNLTGEDVPDELKARLISREWVEARRRRWGETSALYKSKVLGEFPETSQDTLISPQLVADAVNRTLEPVGPNELGVDVARFGRNETVIYHRRGPVARLWIAERKRDTMYVAGLVCQAVVATGATVVKIDDAGLGGGVVDRCNEIKRDRTIVPNPLATCMVIGVNVGRQPIERPSDRIARPMLARDRRERGERVKSEPRMRFMNLKAQLSYEVRDLFVDGNIDLDPDDMDVQAQTCEIRYDLNSRGLIKIESKEDVEERLRKIDGATGESGSPDRWDALVLAFAEVVASPPVVVSTSVLQQIRMTPPRRAGRL